MPKDIKTNKTENSENNALLRDQTEELSVNTRTTTASQPFFSIIITTYNRAQLLKRAIDSMISQIEKDWEAIIVDDESTDDTYLQIQPYLKTHSNLRYLKKAHSGEALSKNLGAESSTGKFLSFLDSDDEYHPMHLEYRKSILLQNPSVKFLYGGTQIIGNQFVPDRFNHAEKVDLNNCVIGGSFIIEKDLFMSLNGFRKIYLGTDADLFDRVKNAGVTMMETSLPTYIYHHETPDSITNKLFENFNK